MIILAEKIGENKTVSEISSRGSLISASFLIVIELPRRGQVIWLSHINRWKLHFNQTSPYATSLAYFAFEAFPQWNGFEGKNLFLKRLQVSPDWFPALPHDKSRTSFLAIRLLSFLLAVAVVSSYFESLLNHFHQVTQLLQSIISKHEHTRHASRGA